MGYLSIEDYSLIGDMRTAALVGLNGAIDWLCYPRFDSPSLFAAILDDQRGGRFQIRPVSEDWTPKQLYWPETNVLITRFLAAHGVGEVSDFMPIPSSQGTRERSCLVRRVHVVRGEIEFVVACTPAFDYARAEHKTHLVEGGVVFEGPDLTMELMGPVDWERWGSGVRGTFTLQTGDHLTITLRQTIPGLDAAPLPDALTEELFHETVCFWRRWVGQCTYQGRWREMVIRSALALKLLTYQPTGAIVAAPTTSLPEAIGGPRNWDYRYTWIRDAAFTLYGLMRIGFTEESTAFMNWLEARCRELEPGQSLQILYGIDGRDKLEEFELPHLEGYKGSKPVRIGNAAYDQLQLDISGELLDAVYLYNKYGSPISYDLWQQITRLISWVCDNWERPDEGIWEVRSGRQHFVYSKLMCWVALDRAIRLAEKRSFPADRARWYATRDAIYNQIMEKGWNPQRQAFTAVYGDNALDASILMMPLVFFLSPADPRLHRTLTAMLQPPERGGLVSDSLVYRYNIQEVSDGLEGEEGAFSMCSFWMTEALTRVGRVVPEYLERARVMFEHMLSYANHTNLYAEETGSTGHALGNFPQAFTHLTLISAAYNLDRALDGR